MASAMLDALEARLRLTGLAERLGPAIERAPDPERAQRGVESVLEAAAEAEGARLAEAWSADGAVLAHALAACCGCAPFLSAFLARHPDALLDLAGGDLSAPRTAADYEERLEAWLAGHREGDEEGALLRRFKYRELVRITTRECTPALVPAEREGEILAELSALADALVRRALACAAVRVAARVSPPRGADAPSAGFAVLALGKLGAGELNYSSDVDLVYVYESAGAAPGAAEYYTRLAQELGRLVGESTAEGFLYRIDLELRPQGGPGALVVSSDAFLHHHEAYAATWEKAAFMKARPVAGDLDFGWRLIRSVHPMIYRSAMDFGGVTAIRELKEKVEEARGGGGGDFDVKVDAGGIRDVEFVAQALQLLHGGRVPQVRGRSTQQALSALVEVDLLPSAEAEGLLESYRFLRRLEHRLQMWEERQTHRLPADPAVRRRVARALGYTGEDGLEAFEGDLAGHRRRVQEGFSALFEESGSERIAALFARHAPRLLAVSETRVMVERLAGAFAREIDASADPERAMNNLVRFIEAVGPRTFYYGLLLDRPELVPRLARLFAASNYLSGFLARHPRLIEPVFSDPNVLLLSRDGLRDDLRSIRDELARAGRRDEVEVGLDALRLFMNREILNVGLLDIDGKVAPEDAERALTEIAEVCLEEALELARAQMRGRAESAELERRGAFLVVGMGKLASRELSYGSDLDVIFLYDVPGADDADRAGAQEYFARLAQKLMWALQTRTGAGAAYAIDARLRPSGSQGPLVTALSSFRAYHEKLAMVWERQALLRARPVAGGQSLARAFEEVRHWALARPPGGDITAEVDRIRQRMEAELARESHHRHDFKTGRGGLLDVECVVQYLQLRYGCAHPQLFEVDRLPAQLDRLEALELLPADDAAALRRGWSFLQRLSSRLRILENRSISDLDEERGDLDALARTLGYPPSQLPGGARRALLNDYREHTRAVRAVYERTLRKEP